MLDTVTSGLHGVRFSLRCNTQKLVSVTNWPKENIWELSDRSRRQVMMPQRESRSHDVDLESTTQDAVHARDDLNRRSLVTVIGLCNK